jgi:hypothetical protein
MKIPPAAASDLSEGVARFACCLCRQCSSNRRIPGSDAAATRSGELLRDVQSQRVDCVNPDIAPGGHPDDRIETTLVTLIPCAQSRRANCGILVCVRKVGRQPAKEFAGWVEQESVVNEDQFPTGGCAWQLLDSPLQRLKGCDRGREHYTGVADVDAENLYEALAIAAAPFREDDINPLSPGLMTEFTVAVYRNPVERKIRLGHVAKWADRSTRDRPAGIMKRQRFRTLLEAHRGSTQPLPRAFFGAGVTPLVSASGIGPTRIREERTSPSARRMSGCLA